MPMDIISKSTNFLLDRFVWGRKPCLDVLPDDIIVDGIFDLLEVEDILCMRRTSKLYFILSHEPVIWKRWLRRIGSSLPLPPLESSAGWSMKKLSALEAERMVTHAISFDKTWHNVQPNFRPGHQLWSFPVHFQITSLCLLPGSQYLIASVIDRTLERCKIIVFTLDHKFGGAVPLAQCTTDTKAFGITAKYLTVKGKQGIVISFLMRHWKRPEYGAHGININEFSGEHEIDPPYPIVYSCTAIHTSLIDLETLAESIYAPGSQEWHQRAETLPSPFVSLIKIHAKHRLGSISLGEAHGVPYLGVIKHPNSILFKRLNGGYMTTFTPHNIALAAGRPHKILGFRLLTQQNQVLVIRRIEEMVEDMGQTAVELYVVPDPAIDGPSMVQLHAVDRRWIPIEYQVSTVYISDQYALESHEAKTDPDKERLFRPRPIAVFCPSTNPPGLMRFTFYPKKADPRWRPPTVARPDGWMEKVPRGGNTLYVYNLREMSIIRRTVLAPGSAAKIIPASMRPILQVYDPDDITSTPKILHMWRWIHPDADRSEPPNTAQEAESDKRHSVGHIGFETGALSRLTCCTWDETIGRMCVVRKDAAHVDVIDMGMTRRLDWREEREPIEVTRSNDPDKLPYWYGGTLLDSKDPLTAYRNAKQYTILLDDPEDEPTE